MSHLQTTDVISTTRGIGLAVALLFTNGCGSNDTPVKALVEKHSMRGDTTVVTNVEGQRWPGVATLEEGVRIGGSDTADEYMFGRIIAMAARGAGPLYVYDDQFHQLRMYDANGRFTRHVGRSGRGPGEFQYVIGMSVLPDGRLAAWDARQNRINLFSADGDRVDELQLLLGGGLFTAKVFATDTAGMFYVLSLSRGRLNTLRVDGGGNIVDTIPFPPGQPFLGMDMVHASLERHLHPHGYYVWGNGSRYVVHTRASNGAPMQIERRVTPAPFTNAERSRYQAKLDSLMRYERDDVRPRGEYGSVPDVKPFFVDILVGSDGTIWVLRQLGSILPEHEQVIAEPTVQQSSTAPRMVFDVFSATGSLLGTVAVPARATIHLIGGEHVWGIVEDDDGVETIVRWRLQVPR